MKGFLAKLIEATARSGLRVIIVGDAAAILHGVPITMTQRVDLMVRSHPQLDKKLDLFAKRFGVALTHPYDPVSRVIRAVGRPVVVDFVFALSSGKSFQSIKSRATRVTVGNRSVLAASLEDIIEAKEAARRPKDKATLPILKDALRVSNKMKENG